MKEKKRKREKRKKDKKSKKKHHHKSRKRHASSSSSPSSPDPKSAKKLLVTCSASPPTDQPKVKKVKITEDEADYAVPLPPGFTAPGPSMAPMTKEQWEAKQSQVRRVLDPETGRTRLVKGEGEIIEEPVSRSRQKEINKQATRSDGDSFQRNLASRL